MPSYQNASELPASDIAIIGGGIVGLWTAYYAAQSGQQVSLIDKSKLGGGASNGILGALMPHQPINWNDKKQFQLDGLTTLPEEIAKLEAQTGIACGYFRCGRVMPIANADKRRQSASWSVGAEENWINPFDWQVKDDNPNNDWLAAVGTYGYNTDSLSARVNPRGLTAALIGVLGSLSNVHILDNSSVTNIDRSGDLQFADGNKFKSLVTIITAGYESFDLLKPLTDKSLGWGVKGQAALLRPQNPINPSSPILYDNGTYVVAHDDGNVAVGSTSERDYTDANTTDAALDKIIESAAKLCPPLEGAEVIERWAGVRPRASGRDPMIGTLPGHPNIVVATGGFKITLAIAHIMARSALSAAAGHASSIPESFRIEAHL